MVSVEFDPFESPSGDGVFSISEQIHDWMKSGTEYTIISTRDVSFNANEGQSEYNPMAGHCENEIKPYNLSILPIIVC